jgi:hypothetical protein
MPATTVISGSCNRIQNFHNGVSVFSSFAGTYGGLPAGSTVSFGSSAIVGNDAAGAINGATPTLDFENNWWGCVAGPGNPGCDAVVGGIDAAPNATSVPACVSCSVNAECDDGLFCTGAETCNVGTSTCVYASDPCAGLERKQQRVILHKALERLPEKERLAIVLRDIEGLSTADVAAILHSSEQYFRPRSARHGLPPGGWRVRRPSSAPAAERLRRRRPAERRNVVHERRQPCSLDQCDGACERRLPASGRQRRGEPSRVGRRDVARPATGSVRAVPPTASRPREHRSPPGGRRMRHAEPARQRGRVGADAKQSGGTSHERRQSVLARPM